MWPIQITLSSPIPLSFTFPRHRKGGRHCAPRGRAFAFGMDDDKLEELLRTMREGTKEERDDKVRTCKDSMEAFTKAAWNAAQAVGMEKEKEAYEAVAAKILAEVQRLEALEFS